MMNSYRKEQTTVNPHIPKPRRRRNLIGVESSQVAQSQVVDPTHVPQYDDGYDPTEHHYVSRQMIRTFSRQRQRRMVLRLRVSMRASMRVVMTLRMMVWMASLLYGFPFLEVLRTYQFCPDMQSMLSCRFCLTLIM